LENSTFKKLNETCLVFNGGLRLRVSFTDGRLQKKLTPQILIIGVFSTNGNAVFFIFQITTIKTQDTKNFNFSLYLIISLFPSFKDKVLKSSRYHIAATIHNYVPFYPAHLKKLIIVMLFVRHVSKTCKSHVVVLNKNEIN